MRIFTTYTIHFLFQFSAGERWGTIWISCQSKNLTQKHTGHKNPPHTPYKGQVCGGWSVWRGEHDSMQKCPDWNWGPSSSSDHYLCAFLIDSAYCTTCSGLIRLYTLWLKLHALWVAFISKQKNAISSPSFYINLSKWVVAQNVHVQSLLHLDSWHSVIFWLRWFILLFTWIIRLCFFSALQVPICACASSKHWRGFNGEYKWFRWIEEELNCMNCSVDKARCTRATKRHIPSAEVPASYKWRTDHKHFIF